MPPIHTRAGTPCPSPDPYVHACEYGGDSNPDCTTFVDCATENLNTPLHWILYPPAATCGQNAQLGCPATSSGVKEGAQCNPGGTYCLYSDAVCGCLPCLDLKNGGVRGTMHCRLRTDVQAGCPTPRPRLGDACSTEGLICDYTQCCGGPSLGPSMQCSGGYWHSYSSGACACPMRICP